MLDIKFVRENPEIVKENIKKKYQFEKLPYVDEVIEFDKKIRALKQESEGLRASRNDLSKQIGALMKEKKIEEANKIKEAVSNNNKRIQEIEPEIESLNKELLKRMMVIPNIIALFVLCGQMKELHDDYYYNFLKK